MSWKIKLIHCIVRRSEKQIYYEAGKGGVLLQIIETHGIFEYIGVMNRGGRVKTPATAKANMKAFFTFLLIVFLNFKLLYGQTIPNEGYNGLLIQKANLEMLNKLKINNFNNIKINCNNGDCFIINIDSFSNIRLVDKNSEKEIQSFRSGSYYKNNIYLNLFLLIYEDWFCYDYIRINDNSNPLVHVRISPSNDLINDDTIYYRYSYNYQNLMTQKIESRNVRDNTKRIITYFYSYDDSSRLTSFFTTEDDSLNNKQFELRYDKSDKLKEFKYGWIYTSNIEPTDVLNFSYYRNGLIKKIVIKIKNEELHRRYRRAKIYRIKYKNISYNASS